MFLDVADLDDDGLEDIVAAVKPASLVCVRRLSKDGQSWKPFAHAWPGRDIAGGPKAFARRHQCRRQTGPGLTCEGATGERCGVWWAELSPFAEGSEVKYHNVGGPPGVKYDLVRAIDLDGDGDLDLVTCEESDNLGVVWYENPLK